MQRSTGWFIFVGFMVLLDLYIFQVVKHLTINQTEKTKSLIHGGFWAVSIIAIVIISLMPILSFDTWPKTARTYFFAIIIGIFISKLMATSFFLIDDLRRGVMWVLSKLSSNANVDVAEGGDAISRSTFLSWLGLAFGGGIFSTLIYGFSNKYNYDVKRVKMQFDNLPNSFKGLKMVHISDVHSGSFTDQAAVQKGIDKILHEKPDIILFTGDLVNDRAIEMNDYKHLFAKLKAPMGVYSTLGNHDYGDYFAWESLEAKSKNLADLKQVHTDMGWRLLMNEHVALEKNGEQIALLGIENWSSRARFPKYGRMSDAYVGAENYPFKILMSHDPSHWDAQVIKDYPTVDLTLAGHTHGMQFGIEIPGFKFSPVQWVYNRWAGLYEEGKQKLYINRGYGFIGYPGRVGILPEITVIELV